MSKSLVGQWLEMEDSRPDWVAHLAAFRYGAYGDVLGFPCAEGFNACSGEWRVSDQSRRRCKKCLAFLAKAIAGAEATDD